MTLGYSSVGHNSSNVVIITTKLRTIVRIQVMYIYIYTWEKHVEYRFGAASGAFEKLVKRVFNKDLNITTIKVYNSVDISTLLIWVWKLESMSLRYPEIGTLSPIKASFNLEYQLVLLCDQNQSPGKVQPSKDRIADH